MESLDPPWLPESAMVARAPCIALEASHVSILDQPPLPGGYITARDVPIGRGDNVRVLDSLFFVFPLFPYLVILRFLLSWFDYS